MGISIVGRKPASTEQKARAERGKKDVTTMAARLLRSAPQGLMESRAARRRAEIAAGPGDGRKSVR